MSVCINTDSESQCLGSFGEGSAVTNFPNEEFELFVFQDEVSQRRASSNPRFSNVF